MSVKEWYQLLVEQNVTKREVDQEGRMEMIPCRVEEKYPEVCWAESYRISRLPGLSPDSKSFLFRLMHELLPSKERIHHLTPASSPLCWCNTGAVETYQHIFYDCIKNNEAGQALLRCVQSYDRSLTEVKSLRVELSADEPFLLASISILSSGLELIWENRKVKKSTAMYSMRAELESSISIKRRSRLRRVKEASKIMENMVENFFN